MDDTLNEGWFDPESATFGDRVAGARDAAGMTQKQLAKRLGVKLSTLQDWENDVNEPRANKLQMLAGVLNVSLTWLLDGSGDGIDSPEAVQPITDELGQVLTELRELKTRANKTANRLGALEKRLRLLAQEGQLG